MAMSRDRFFELVRYYQAGILNTAYGLGAYSLLVWLGLNMYAAQLIAHCSGVAFNYFTYSRHAFRGTRPAKRRFVIAYGFNYLLGLATLAVVAHWVRSPYLAGFITAVLVSIANYFILKRFIFLQAPAPQ